MDSITVTGLVATEPRHLVTAEGLPITSFRLASTQRRYDRRAGSWVDGDTNWFTVSAFRHLAIHAARSLARGDRVVVAGRLKVRDWNSGDRSGTAVEVEAEALGHDLTWGTSRFTRQAGGTDGRSSPREPGAAGEARAVAESKEIGVAEADEAGREEAGG